MADPIADALTAIRSELGQFEAVTHAIARCLDDDKRNELDKNSAVLVAKAGRVQQKVVDYIGALERLERVRTR